MEPTCRLAAPCTQVGSCWLSWGPEPDRKLQRKLIIRSPARLYRTSRSYTTTYSQLATRLALWLPR